jgi:transcriptional regulator with XRE-family HTH domain
MAVTTIRFETLYDVCRFLRVERKERGWTLAKAGELAGLAPSTVMRIEDADHDAQAANLWKLAAAYGFRLTLSPTKEGE